MILTAVSLFSQEKKSTIPGNTIEEIVIKGNFEIMLFQADSEDLYIHAPANVSRNIKSEFSDGVYYLSNNNPAGLAAKVYLVVTDLKKLKTWGAVNIKTPTNLYLKNLTLQLSEESNANLFITSEDLTLNIEGSGYVQISGDIDTLRLRTSESANASFDLKSKKIYATLKGESEVQFEGDLFSLYAELYQYSILDNLNSVTGTCIVSTKDKTMARLKAEDKFYLHASDRSTIIYKGKGVVEISEKDKNASIRPEQKQKALVTKK